MQDLLTDEMFASEFPQGLQPRGELPEESKDEASEADSESLLTLETLTLSNAVSNVSDGP